MKPEELFSIHNENDFLKIAMQVFEYQHKYNNIYQKFCTLLGKSPENVSSLEEIPFLPIEFFKEHNIQTKSNSHEIIFTSSGTTGDSTSKHYVKSLALYRQSFIANFEMFYGPIKDYVILGLLPSYLERTGSSLVYMVEEMISMSKQKESGFFLHDFKTLYQLLKKTDPKKKIILIGASFGLLDFVEQYSSLQLENTIVMETGGMKGRRKELIREELHQRLKIGFGVKQIHSEYGMTELLSQAYAKDKGVFECPPQMKVLIRDTEDPLRLLPKHKNGGINIIDLANIDSVSFIATQDLGKQVETNKFEVLGRFDNSDIRGCNLLVL
ncbi:MAG: acyl transferase [Bacteroidota bacterium]